MNRARYPQSENLSGVALAVPHTLGAMPFEMSRPGQSLVGKQRGVLSRPQAKKTGLSRHAIDNRLKAGRWVRKYWGVYATVTGKLEREAELRAALLRAGEGATLSHWTAAEKQGLIDGFSEVIHISVPGRRQPARHGRIKGVQIHRSTILGQTRKKAGTLPMTEIQHTVIDCVNTCVTFEAAYDLICKAIGRGLITADRLLATVNSRRRVKFRVHVKVVLGEAEGGIRSWLEQSYTNGVEDPHGIPPGLHQFRVNHETASAYLDIFYVSIRLCVELDGTAAHPQDEQWRDKNRDNWNLVYEKIQTLRFGVPHVRTQEDCCKTAAMVVKMHRDAGECIGHPCSRPGCAVRLLDGPGSAGTAGTI